LAIRDRELFRLQGEAKNAWLAALDDDSLRSLIA